MESDYDTSSWTYDDIIRFLESSGTVPYVHMAIFGHDIDVDDPRWDDWKKPYFSRLRRAVASAYMYGIHVHNLTGSKSREV